MTAGYVLFRLGEQTYALGLEAVREIVRLSRLDPLPGMASPMAGVIVLRGNPLPVMDLRPEPVGEAGDVLVTVVADEPLGVAVNEVVAVVAPDELPLADQAAAAGLPAYVVEVRRSPSGPVLVVDLARLLDRSAATAGAAAQT